MGVLFGPMHEISVRITCLRCSGFRCCHKQRMDADDGSDQTLDLQLCWTRYHMRFRGICSHVIIEYGTPQLYYVIYLNNIRQLWRSIIKYQNLVSFLFTLWFYEDIVYHKSSCQGQ